MVIVSRVAFSTLTHALPADYQVKLSEKFDQLGGVIKDLIQAGNNGDTSVMKSSIANLERMQNSLVRQIESNGLVSLSTRNFHVNKSHLKAYKQWDKM
jgi:hypothetical protein